MSELDHVNPEYLKELRTPEEIMEGVLHDIIRDGTSLSMERFDNEGDAYDAATALLNEATNAIGKVENPRSIELLVSGPGVRMPKPTYGEYDDGEGMVGLVVAIPKDNALTPLEPFELEKAYIDHVNSIIGRDEDGFRVMINLVISFQSVDTHGIKLTDDINVIRIDAYKMGIIRVGEPIEVLVAELEDLRASQRLQAEIAKYGIAGTAFELYRNKLVQTFHNEHPVEFTPMASPNILRKAGSFGSLLARKGADQSNTVSHSLLEVLGKERRIKIGYEQEIIPGYPEVTTVTGTVLEVLMPMSASDDSPACIVVSTEEGSDSDGEARAIPFEKIKQFSF